ncbi:hypothetical protein CDD83_9314 [Cordyceps sp. RAO-2017]|nr:hypothetical protein CDD83_9314 [Cordyceps sp. RAO-2017]
MPPTPDFFSLLRPTPPLLICLASQISRASSSPLPHSPSISPSRSLSLSPSTWRPPAPPRRAGRHDSRPEPLAASPPRPPRPRSAAPRCAAQVLQFPASGQRPTVPVVGAATGLALSSRLELHLMQLLGRL